MKEGGAEDPALWPFESRKFILIEFTNHLKSWDMELN